MTDNTTTVKLTDKELILLDGYCSDKVQAEVALAKERIDMASKMPEKDATVVKLIQDVVNLAKTQGVIGFRYWKLKTCPVCGKSDGYYVYPRTTKYHRKGEMDYSHPRYLNGVELASPFVVMDGYVNVGCCYECFQKYKEDILDALKDIPAEISKNITGVEPIYKKYDNRKCASCGWEGHEGEMGKRLTMMGNGYYPATCPQCKAENEMFSHPVERRDGFVVVRVK